jgi:DNA-binding transcriptional MocR family regulator
MDSAQVLQDAVKRKVAFVPGGPFFPNGGGQNTMRLNFSNATNQNIQEGIYRLGTVLREKVGVEKAAQD